MDNTTEGFDADVIVVGAGFAGATAARELAERGHSVLIVEARERIGGRTYYRPFAGTTMMLEMGGTWVNPRYQPHIAAELARYDTGTFPSPTPSAYAWGLQGEVTRSTIPLPVAEWTHLERLLVAVSQAAQRVRFSSAPMGQPGLEDLDIPLSEWLDGFELPPLTRDFAMAWPSFYMGGGSSEVSALHFLTWTAGFENSAVVYLTELTDKVAGGTVSLVEKMITESGARTLLDTTVAAVTQEAGRVVVRTGVGTHLRARGVVITAPVNTWHDIEFEPALTGAYAALADEGQPAHTIKIWILVRGLTENFFGVGKTTVFKWLASEYPADEGTYMVGFALPDDLDPSDTAAVTRAVQEFLPDVEVISTDFHDWNNDPYSQGTWMAYRPGQIMRITPGLLESHGNVVFAGSDVAHGWAGWIDGAIESGTRAAEQLHGRLPQIRRNGLGPMNVTFDFTERVVLVSGATGGIGRAIAHLFSDSGADLLLADIDESQLETLTSELRGAGRVFTHRYDATDPEAASRLAEHAGAAFGGIDILVPAAGIYPTDPVAEMDAAVLDRVLQINLTSVVMLIRQCIPLLRVDSSIVTLSSVAAHRGSINHAHYAMSKAGILALTRTLAGELAPRTRVNAVSPGTIDTPMARPNIEVMGDRILAATPQKRFGSAAEVAATVAFLASEGGGFIDGENLHINGGWYIG